MPPTLNFPRNEKVKPNQQSGITVPGALQLRSGSGVLKTRQAISAGRTWTETYNMLRAGDVDVENFISFLRRVWSRGEFFNIKHLSTPGSGLDPNGTGTSGVTVSGASQTGDTLTTTGWPASTSGVAKSGDLIRVGGIGKTFEIIADANSDGSGNATLTIDPPIFAGSSPAGGASVTTTGVDIYAALFKNPKIPDWQNGFYYSGIELTFIEVPNA